MKGMSYGTTATLGAGFRRFVAARQRGHLLVAQALDRPHDQAPQHRERHECSGDPQVPGCPLQRR